MTVRRRPALFAAAGALAAVALLALTLAARRADSQRAGPSPSAERRPNILVYMIDTLRADELGCYGAKITRTPNTDTFAGEGTVFENCTALASGTRPSIASFITGVSGEIHEQWGGDRTPVLSTLARLPGLLKKCGYHTMGVVANPNVAAEFGFAEGYDVYHEMYAEKANPDTHRLDSNAEVVVNKLLETLAAAPADKPFFLYSLTIDPHSPYTPPGSYEKMYAADANGESDGSIKTLMDMKDALKKGKKPDARKLQALYRGEISYADHQFERVLVWLREKGRLDDTVVVLTADHGEEFLDHNGLGHGNTVYEEVTRIPMIVRYPAMFKPGTRRADPIDMLDLSATLLAIGGADKPSYWFGRDFRGPVAPRAIFTTHKKTPNPLWLSAARQDGYKLLRNNAKGTTNYYYLPDDPREQQPLAGDQKDKAEKLLARKVQDYQRVNQSLKQQLLAGAPNLAPGKASDDVRKALDSLGYAGGGDFDGASAPTTQPATQATAPSARP